MYLVQGSIKGALATIMVDWLSSKRVYFIVDSIVSILSMEAISFIKFRSGMALYRLWLRVIYLASIVLKAISIWSLLYQHREQLNNRIMKLVWDNILLGSI